MLQADGLVLCAGYVCVFGRGLLGAEDECFEVIYHLYSYGAGVCGVFRSAAAWGVLRVVSRPEPGIFSSASTIAALAFITPTLVLASLVQHLYGARLSATPPTHAVRPSHIPFCAGHL